MHLKAAVNLKVSDIMIQSLFSHAWHQVRLLCLHKKNSCSWKRDIFGFYFCLSCCREHGIFWTLEEELIQFFFFFFFCSEVRVTATSCRSHSCECNTSGTSEGYFITSAPNLNSLDKCQEQCDITKHAFGHNSKIHLVIMTTFYATV